MKQMKGLTFVETISITFEKMSQDGVTNKTAYFKTVPNAMLNIFYL